MLPDRGLLLRIFIGEHDKHEKVPLYEWLVRRAREQGLAGCTVIRGLQGFGARSRFYNAKILRLSQDLPIVVEIIDSEDKIESYLDSIEGSIRDGLVTTENVGIRIYRTGRQSLGRRS